MADNVQVMVVGAGVIGLSAGIKLLEAGFKNVTLVAEHFGNETTSAGAGAMWRPVYADDSQMFQHWADVTFKKFLDILGTVNSQEHKNSSLQKNTRYKETDYRRYHPTAGLSLVRGMEVFQNLNEPDPVWQDTVFGFTRLHVTHTESGIRLCDKIHGSTSEAPVHKTLLAHAFTSVLVNMPQYLAYLLHVYRKLGGRVQKLHCPLASLEELFSQCSKHVGLRTSRPDTDMIVVNCTGLGSRLLMGDTMLTPGRGQTVKVYAPDIKEFTVSINDDEGLAYIIPRGDGTVILGGTNDQIMSTDSYAADVSGILDRCLRLVPALKNSKILSTWAGLRPMRDTVRLEATRIGRNSLCIHNYGHGGSGVTVHWGCAEAVRDLAIKFIRDPDNQNSKL
eukprot:m.344699 g.344699  ORF g.344699 m.344699 type:complete len:392 (+) comp24961_c0_seq1:330-1505(+)